MTTTMDKNNDRMTLINIFTEVPNSYDFLAMMAIGKSGPK